MPRDRKRDALKFVYCYCDKHRNDQGCWDYLYEFRKSTPDKIAYHGMCPECQQEYFPDEYSSITREKKVPVTEKIPPGNRTPFGCFFIVTNMGYLYGGHNKEQRL